jgi:hypothetical protein
MKTQIFIIGLSLGVFAAVSAVAQGTFQNLDFESANVGSLPASVAVSSALPGWSVYYGSDQQTEIGCNIVGTGSTLVLLQGLGSGYPIIDGNYSVLLQGGVTASAASISQTGFIAASDQTLLFKELGAIPGSGNFAVLIGNQSIPVEAVSTGTTVSGGYNYTLYGADISAWAGQTEQLTFSALEGNNNNFLLDDISFSTSPLPTLVPEPDAVVLTGIGGVVFALRRRWLSVFAAARS